MHTDHADNFCEARAVQQSDGNDRTGGAELQPGLVSQQACTR